VLRYTRNRGNRPCTAGRGVSVEAQTDVLDAAGDGAHAAYVAAAPSATVFYIANVLLHLLLGAASVVWLGFGVPAQRQGCAAGSGRGVGRVSHVAGATTDHRGILVAHIALAVAGLAVLMPRWSAPLAVLAVLALALRFGAPPRASATPRPFRSP